MILNSQVTALRQESSGFPRTLLAGLGSSALAEVWTAGPLSVLDRPKIGFFCSSRCPGSIILKTFDAIIQMRDEGQILIGGFHSVMERECLGILLRGCQPVIWVPARSIANMRLKPELIPSFQDGRLLIISPFPTNHKRITGALAEERNRFVAAIADRVFVHHAAPNSRTLALLHYCRQQAKPIFTVSDPHNAVIATFATMT
jgi:hypothetical protein